MHVVSMQKVQMALVLDEHIKVHSSLIGIAKFIFSKRSFPTKRLPLIFGIACKPLNNRCPPQAVMHINGSSVEVFPNEL